TAIAAKPHEPHFPEREARRIEGGGARDGYGLGFVRFICLLCGRRRHILATQWISREPFMGDFPHEQSAIKLSSACR
ncbi:MAG: hypothetical protein R3F21_10350, partial [Myxococcota bacterium]